MFLRLAVKLVNDYRKWGLTEPRWTPDSRDSFIAVFDMNFRGLSTF